MTQACPLLDARASQRSFLLFCLYSQFKDFWSIGWNKGQVVVWASRSSTPTSACWVWCHLGFPRMQSLLFSPQPQWLTCFLNKGNIHPCLLSHRVLPFPGMKAFSSPIQNTKFPQRKPRSPFSTVGHPSYSLHLHVYCLVIPLPAAYVMEEQTL